MESQDRAHIIITFIKNEIPKLEPLYEQSNIDGFIEGVKGKVRQMSDDLKKDDLKS